MTPKTVIIIQTLLEGILPVVGYFYWNWDASFIFLFFLIDWVMHWVLSVVKSRKCMQIQQLDSATIRQTKNNLGIGLSGIFITSTFVYFTLHQVHQSFSWNKRIGDFLSYTDMGGIPQGFILIPLLVAVGLMDYKQKFVKFELFKKIPAFVFTQNTRKQAIYASISFGLVLILSSIYSISDELLLFGTVIGVLTFRMLHRNELGV